MYVSISYKALEMESPGVSGRLNQSLETNVQIHGVLLVKKK